MDRESVNINNYKRYKNTDNTYTHNTTTHIHTILLLVCHTVAAARYIDTHILLL